MIKRSTIESAIAKRNGKITSIYADIFILACGALGTPALLLRSGIGPASELINLGVPVSVDLPGVGKNLSEHARLSIDLLPTDALIHLLKRNEAAGRLFASSVVLRVCSSRCDSRTYDLNILPIAGKPLFADDNINRYTASVGVFLMKPRSRGSVTLTSSNIKSPLRVDPALLSDECGNDVRALKDGLAVAYELVSCPELASFAHVPPRPHSRLTDSDLRSLVGVYWHPTGTCKMGKGNDPMAVTDGTGLVYGFDNLYAADASIFPSTPRANTQLSVIAAAEMLSDSIYNRIKGNKSVGR
jgi:choline dehydrogenase